jgi:hypothetical protein
VEEGVGVTAVGFRSGLISLDSSRSVISLSLSLLLLGHFVYIALRLISPTYVTYTRMDDALLACLLA